MKGRKTYLIALGAVLAAVGGYLTGEFTLADAINTFVVGGGLASLRAALADVAKGEKPPAWLGTTEGRE